MPVMPNSSHLDAVPQATTISRTRVHNKKVKIAVEARYVYIEWNYDVSVKLL